MDDEPPSPVSIAVDDPAWLEAVADVERLCRGAVEAALAGAAAAKGTPAPPAGAVEVGVVLADDEAVRELNRRYRGLDRPTNVLSFPTGAAPTPPPGPPAADHAGATPLGDVVLALGTVVREAGEAGTRTADHLSHLVVHGTLHLLGYDHDADAAAAEMEALETAILAGLGIADPYALEEATEAPRG